LPRKYLKNLKGLARENDVICCRALVTTKKSFITLTLGVIVIKLFSFVADNEA